MKNNTIFFFKLSKLRRSILQSLKPTLLDQLQRVLFLILLDYMRFVSLVP